ncbi:MAG: hypothetical protein Q8O67_32320 [Deltaproteobacteria bacterium]|nr:hypothetical protein [Deltaproteobacteria bacterium]
MQELLGHRVLESEPGLPAWLEVTRAVGGHGRLVHIVRVPSTFVDVALADLLLDACPLSWGDGYFVIPCRPCVPVRALLARGREEGGDLPVDVAVFVVAELARTVARLHRGHYRLPAAGALAHTRIGLDGSVALWAFHGCPRRVHDQVHDRVSDVRTDVFELGCALWTMLASEHEVIPPEVMRTEEPPSFSRLPGALLKVLRSALDVDADFRPNGADELALALDAIVAQGGVSVTAGFPRQGDAARSDQAIAPEGGRAATAALVRGLFPERAAQEAASVEQVTLDVDLGAPVYTPPVPPAPTPPRGFKMPRLPPPPPALRQTTMVTTRLWLLSGARASLELVRDDTAPHRIITNVSATVAAEVARGLGGRLPTQEEWLELAGGRVLGEATGLGEWATTTTTTVPGFVVCRCPPRGAAPIVTPGADAAVDVGFRLVFD